jgi:hypothetical protein
LSRKLFANDLAHHLCRKGLLPQTQIGVEHIVDAGLITFSSFLGLSLRTLLDRIVEIDSDASLPNLGNHRSAFALREIIFLLHMSFLESKVAVTKQVYAYIANPA